MNINGEVRLRPIGIVWVALMMMVCAGPAVSAEPAPEFKRTLDAFLAQP